MKYYCNNNIDRNAKKGENSMKNTKLWRFLSVFVAMALVVGTMGIVGVSAAAPRFEITRVEWGVTGEHETWTDLPAANPVQEIRIWVTAHDVVGTDHQTTIMRYDVFSVVGGREPGDPGEQEWINVGGGVWNEDDETLSYVNQLDTPNTANYMIRLRSRRIRAGRVYALRVSGSGMTSTAMPLQVGARLIPTIVPGPDAPVLPTNLGDIPWNAADYSGLDLPDVPGGVSQSLRFYVGGTETANFVGTTVADVWATAALGGTSYAAVVVNAFARVTYTSTAGVNEGMTSNATAPFTMTAPMLEEPAAPMAPNLANDGTPQTLPNVIENRFPVPGNFSPVIPAGATAQYFIVDAANVVVSGPYTTAPEANDVTGELHVRLVITATRELTSTVSQTRPITVFYTLTVEQATMPVQPAAPTYDGTALSGNEGVPTNVEDADAIVWPTAQDTQDADEIVITFQTGGAGNWGTPANTMPTPTLGGSDIPVRVTIVGVNDNGAGEARVVYIVLIAPQTPPGPAMRPAAAPNTIVGEAGWYGTGFFHLGLSLMDGVTPDGFNPFWQPWLLGFDNGYARISIALAPNEIAPDTNGYVWQAIYDDEAVTNRYRVNLLWSPERQRFDGLIRGGADMTFAQIMENVSWVRVQEEDRYEIIYGVGMAWFYGTSVWPEDPLNAGTPLTVPMFGDPGAMF